MLTSLALLTLLSLASGQQQKGCPCDKFVFTDNVPVSHMVVRIFDERPVREIRGTVTDFNGASPAEKAFIFVTRMPRNMTSEDYDAGKYRDGRSLIACETVSDGKFCFKNMQPGKYEVCATSSGFNNTCVLITVSNTARRKAIDIRLEPGT